MLEILTQPGGFFQRLSARKPNLVMPFLIVVAGVTLSVVSQALLTRLLPIPGGFALQAAFGIIGGLVFGILMWGVLGLVIRLLAGADARAWEVYGWSLVPSLLMGLVLLPVAALFPVTGDLPPAPALTDAEALRAWQKQFQEVVRSGLGTQVVRVLGLLATLWSLWLLYAGLRVFAPARAVLATVVVGAIGLGLAVWGFLQ